MLSLRSIVAVCIAPIQFLLAITYVVFYRKVHEVLFYSFPDPTEGNNEEEEDIDDGNVEDEEEHEAGESRPPPPDAIPPASPDHRKLAGLNLRRRLVPVPPLE